MHKTTPDGVCPKGTKARLGKGRVAGSASCILRTANFSRLASSIGIWIYDSDAGATLGLLTASTSVSTVVFSPDGAMLTSGGYDRNVRLWEVETGREIVRVAGHKGGIAAVTFSPSSTLILRDEYGRDGAGVGCQEPVNRSRCSPWMRQRSI